MAAINKYPDPRVGRIIELFGTENITNREICRQVGISTSTLRKWIKQKPELANVVVEIKQKRFDTLIQHAIEALQKKVCGYTLSETKTTYVTDKNGEQSIKEISVVTKDVAPDLAAIIFTLTNRDCDNWRQKPAAEQPEQEPEPSTVDLSQLSETTLRELASIQTKK